MGVGNNIQLESQFKNAGADRWSSLLIPPGLSEKVKIPSSARWCAIHVARIIFPCESDKCDGTYTYRFRLTVFCEIGRARKIYICKVDPSLRRGQMTIAGSPNNASSVRHACFGCSFERRNKKFCENKMADNVRSLFN